MANGRLGSAYRRLVLQSLGIAPRNRWTLDVGGHDGSVLTPAPGTRVVALDLSPEDPRSGVDLVRGDGKAAPFRPGQFTAVFALDVLEHEVDDVRLFTGLLDLLAPDGLLWVSVPSRSYRAAPRWTTAWLHRRWGHVRPGYTLEGLLALVPPGWEVEVVRWNGPAFRTLYLPLRLLWSFVPRLARFVLRAVARVDARNRDGDHGHYFIKVQRAPLS